MKVFQVWHINRDNADRDDIRDLMCSYGAEQVALAKRLFSAGSYEHVANVVANDMEAAFQLTDNDLQGSWSRSNDVRITQIEPRFHILDGETYGRKSTSSGDIIIVDGAVFVVAFMAMGFKLLGKEVDLKPALV